jgi:hypothetical protein
MKSLFYPLVVLLIALGLPGCGTSGSREDAVIALSSKGITPEELDKLDAKFAKFEKSYRFNIHSFNELARRAFVFDKDFYR